MSTQTRTPEEIFEEIRVLANPRPPDRSAGVAGRLAYWTGCAERYEREAQLWDEICRIVIRDASAPMWALAAAELAQADRLTRAAEMREHERAAALRDLPNKEGL